MTKNMPRQFCIIAIITLAALTQKLSGQVFTRPQQNAQRVVVTFRYEVNNGERTPNFCVVKQEIKDSLNRLHTILHWNCQTKKVENYVWHTFDGKKIICTQTFSDGQLRLQQNFAYNPDSTLLSERILRIAPGDTGLYATLQYTRSGNTLRIEALNAQGKRAWVTQSTFNHQGLEISRKTKVCKGFAPLDSIASIRRWPTYDSLNRLCHERIEQKHINGSQTLHQIAYAYNAKGQLVQRTVSDAKGHTIHSERMEYSWGDALKTISKYDASGVLVDYHFKRYEFYPTENRQQRIIEHM